MSTVADTSPLNYLIQIDLAPLLPHLYGPVLIPEGVIRELSHAGAPISVQRWMLTLPSWIEIYNPNTILNRELDRLDLGERQAIELALQTQADLLLIDERKGRAVARKLGLSVSGTLGVIRDAHGQGWVDGRSTFDLLKSKTTFRYSETTSSAFLDSLHP